MTPSHAEKPHIDPSNPSERNRALDALRGFALLGILVMNVQSFGMIDAAYLNPTAYGDLTGINKLTWLVSHHLADMKFMALFSMMFGASVLLFTDRLQARGIRPAGLYYRRIFWLIVFGMLHAYLLWHGDILVAYGLCGLLIYLFRKTPPRVVFILGLLVVSVSSLLYLMFQWSMPQWEEADLAELAVSWAPAPAQIEEMESGYRSGWWAQMSQRAPGAFFAQTFLFLILIGWRAGGLMLVGMALYRWKVLTGERSERFYIGCILAGLLIGLPIVAYGAYRNFAAGWAMETSFFGGSQFNYWGSLLVSLGYIGLIMLAWRRGWAKGVLNRLAEVGRTAFSNYIFQTVLCTTLFYGHGFGLYGKVPRFGLFLIVLAVWTIQLILTHLWLKRFRMGPLEWLWRTLTYMERQPMRRHAASQ